MFYVKTGVVARKQSWRCLEVSLKKSCGVKLTNDKKLYGPSSKISRPSASEKQPYRSTGKAVYYDCFFRSLKSGGDL